jgi:hypothetical protein
MVLERGLVGEHVGPGGGVVALQGGDRVRGPGEGGVEEGEEHGPGIHYPPVCAEEGFQRETEGPPQEPVAREERDGDGTTGQILNWPRGARACAYGSGRGRESGPERDPLVDEDTGGVVTSVSDGVIRCDGIRSRDRGDGSPCGMGGVKDGGGSGDGGVECVADPPQGGEEGGTHTWCPIDLGLVEIVGESSKPSAKVSKRACAFPVKPGHAFQCELIQLVFEVFRVETEIG